MIHAPETTIWRAIVYSSLLAGSTSWLTTLTCVYTNEHLQTVRMRPSVRQFVVAIVSILIGLSTHALVLFALLFAFGYGYSGTVGVESALGM